MGNIKRGEISKTELIQKWEKLKGRKAPSYIHMSLKEDLRREVEFLEKNKRKRADYRKMLREKGESK